MKNERIGAGKRAMALAMMFAVAAFAMCLGIAGTVAAADVNVNGIWESWIGLGSITLGVVAIAIFAGGKILHVAGEKAMWLNLVALGVGISAVVAAVGGAATTQNPLPPGEIAADWNIAGVETDTHQIQPTLTTFHGLVTVNTTTPIMVNNTGWLNYNFTYSRLDGSATYHYLTFTVENVAEYVDVTTGFKYSPISVGSDGLLNADFTSSAGVTTAVRATGPAGETRADYTTLNVTLNAACFDAMAGIGVGQGSGFSIVCRADGVAIQTWNVDVVLNDIYNA
jgi:hypothetical protein